MAARTMSVGRKVRMSRLRTHAKNNLGVIMTGDMNNTDEWRKDCLDLLDRYFDNTQYDELMEWEDAAKSQTYVPVRERKPRIIYNLPKALVNKVASKIVGASTFPKFVIEEDPDDTDFLRLIQKSCNYRQALLDPVKHMLRTGSNFIRYYFVNGTPIIENYNSKYCYPEFDEVGELEAVEIKYVYDDEDDKDASGNFKKKWFKLDLTKTSDILYDNPEYRQGAKPVFTEVDRNDHKLGWVQGEWLCTDKDKHDPDGWSLYGDILGFIDDFNYSLSQTSQGIGYNQEPQLGLNGMDEDEIENLIRSSQKAWNLGKEGKGEFIESDLKGIEQAEAQRDHNRKLILDVVRVVLHDPEKMVAQAQSGEALKALNMPLVELVDELRTVLEKPFRNLLLKIALTTLVLAASGVQVGVTIPKGYQPTSLDVDLKWPLLFPPTLNDVYLMSQAANNFSTQNIISRESLTRWIAPYVGVDNIDEELEKIAAQEPLPSPFGDAGGFGGGQ